MAVCDGPLWQQQDPLLPKQLRYGGRCEKAEPSGAGGQLQQQDRPPGSQAWTQPGAKPAGSGAFHFIRSFVKGNIPQNLNN